MKSFFEPTRSNQSPYDVGYEIGLSGFFLDKRNVEKLRAENPQDANLYLLGHYQGWREYREYHKIPEGE